MDGIPVTEMNEEETINLCNGTGVSPPFEFVGRTKYTNDAAKIIRENPGITILELQGMMFGSYSNVQKRVTRLRHLGIVRAEMAREIKGHPLKLYWVG